MEKAIKIVLVMLVAALVGAGLWFIAGRQTLKKHVSSFEECAAAGNPIMESYPRRCRADGQVFVEQIQDQDQDQ
jgi:flagellar basal body-associated protein FliL